MITVLITFISISVLGVDFTTRNMYPTYALAKMINIGQFFQRVEAMIAGAWFLTIFFKLSICFYVSTLGLAQILNLKDYRSLTFPLGIITVVLSIVAFPNIVSFHVFAAKIWTPYALTYGLFLPLLLLVVGKIKKHRKTN